MRKPKGQGNNPGYTLLSRCERNASTNEHPTCTSILRWDEQQSAYIGQTPEIVGVEDSDSTYKEALASVLEAIRWWQEMSTRQPALPVQPENDGSC